MSVSRHLQEKAWQILANRAQWERKQRLYYEMRHDGLRRVSKPFESAADQHLPLVDMNIADLKPFWSAQVFGGSRLCDFTSLRRQESATTEAAADYHSFELNQFSNYRIAMETAIDTMLLRGRAVIMAVTDPYNDHAIKFRAINPIYLLMDEMYDDFDDADEWTWIQTLSVAQYRRNKNYNQDASVVAKIRGRKGYTLTGVELDVQLREGVTHSERNDAIILYHHWRRTDGDYIVTTYSPMADDVVIRAPHGCPYVINGKPSQPFFSLTMEVKDEGWYSPRGVAELNAAFEAYGCTLWNHKTDAMTFGNTPLFTSEGEIPNSANITFKPGSFIPGNVKAVQMPEPAYSFDQEINFARGLAEQRSRVPDFGITDGDSAGGSSKPRTATENNRIAGLQNVGADYNGEIFRNVRLQKIYRHTWGLLLQFKRKRISYIVGEELKEMPEQAYHDQYLVVPTGGPANKQEKLQRAGARYQLFAGKPNIDQDELAKDVLAADDARLVGRMLIPSNQRQMTEAYQAAVDISVMLTGYPAPVLPDQDHATRILTMAAYLHKQALMGAPADPTAIQRIQQNMAQRMEYLRKMQPEAAKAVIQQIQQMEAQVTPMVQAVAPMPAQQEVGAV